jgi:hypothetical protein
MAASIRCLICSALGIALRVAAQPSLAFEGPVGPTDAGPSLFGVLRYSQAARYHDYRQGRREGAEFLEASRPT